MSSTLELLSVFGEPDGLAAFGFNWRVWETPTWEVIKYARADRGPVNLDKLKQETFHLDYIVFPLNYSGSVTHYQIANRKVNLLDILKIIHGYYLIAPRLVMMADVTNEFEDSYSCEVYCWCSGGACICDPVFGKCRKNSVCCRWRTPFVARMQKRQAVFFRPLSPLTDGRAYFARSRLDSLMWVESTTDTGKQCRYVSMSFGL